MDLVLQDLTVHTSVNSTAMVNETNGTLMHVKYDGIQNIVFMFSYIMYISHLMHMDIWRLPCKPVGDLLMQGSVFIIRIETPPSSE